MAISNTNMTTLSDLARLVGKNNVAMTPIAEVLTQTNDMIADISFKQCNNYTGHQFRIRTDKPTVHWTMAGQATPSSKSRAAIVTEDCAMLEAVSTVERKEANLGSNTPALVRASQDTAFIEAMGDEFATTLIYGSKVTDARKFTGLASRFNVISSAANQIGNQVLSASGVANLTSMWLVGWGDDTVYGLVPEGTSAGLTMIDDGLVHTESNNMHSSFYKTTFQWNVGLAVQDWRYVARVCNINVATLTKDAETGTDLIEYAIRAKNRIHKLSRVRPVWYVNQDVYTYLELQASYHPNVRYGKEGAGSGAGYDVLNLCGIPVRRMDAITTAESIVA